MGRLLRAAGRTWRGGCARMDVRIVGVNGRRNGVNVVSEVEF